MARIAKTRELYKDIEEWSLAWETYKYINRNPHLRETEIYREIEAFTEDILVRRGLWRNGKTHTYEDLQDFYRFYVTLENKHQPQDFELTDDVIQHYKELIN